MILVLPKWGCNGVDGVAGTLEAFLRILDVLWTFGSFLLGEPESSKISRSVLPVYLNFVPQEKKPPPDTTEGASELVGKLYSQDYCLNWCNH